MRTFSCFTFDRTSSVPTLALILAADEARARELARRELLDARAPISFELHEDGKMVWRESA